MRPLNSRNKLFIIVFIMGVSISLNFLTLMQAYPETQKIDSGCCAPKGTLLAKDFSAFYFGSWNLIHDPSAIYQRGSSVNASFLGITPHPESFKYLPSFLILILPFLFLSYPNAVLGFDIIQFALLFLIALLVYRLLEGKNVGVIGFASVIALLLPFTTLPSWGISEAYFWQWAEGQDKVLDLALILLALYFGMKKRPVLSGIIFGLSFFDPRFALVAVPLFVTLNREKFTQATIVTISVIAISNVPILAYPGLFPSFLQMFLSVGVTTPLYYYSYIPLLTVLVLSVAKRKEIAQAFSRHRGIGLETRRNISKFS